MFKFRKVAGHICEGEKSPTQFRYGGPIVMLHLVQPLNFG